MLGSIDAMPMVMAYYRWQSSQQNLENQIAGLSDKDSYAQTQVERTLKEVHTKAEEEYVT